MRFTTHGAGPLLVLLAGLAIAFAFALLAGGPFAPEDPWILEYEPVEKVGFWWCGTASAAAVGWWALRAPRRTPCRFVGLGFAAIWVLVGGALSLDILYAVFGPGIPTVANCGSGMDCIGKPVPMAPLLGGADLVAIYLFLATPVVLVSLVVSTMVDARARARRRAARGAVART